LSPVNSASQSSADQPDPAARATREEKEPAALIAEVSHELRLPIANLKLLVETLLDGAAEDPDALRRMLSRAQQEVERLNKLVVNLLSVEQVAASRHQVVCEWMPLAERALYAFDTVKAQALEKGVAVNVEVSSDFRIYANQAQLDQVLLNLLENAVKFTPVGGTVHVRPGPEPGSFAITDTGIGIPASEIPKIFQRFYRIDRAQSRGSTGLGLSIVKHIADLHGAKINVTSEEGRGSTFLLEFPGPA
jgi:two-component system phosphate regulon sensor histidine kinase PhoR